MSKSESLIAFRICPLHILSSMSHFCLFLDSTRVSLSFSSGLGVFKTYTTYRETNRKCTLFCHLIKFPPSKRSNFTILVANSLSVAMDTDFYKRNIAFRLLENCNKNLDKSAPRRVRIPFS